MEKRYYESAFAFLDLLSVTKLLETDDGVFLNTLGNIYHSAIKLCTAPLQKQINYQIFSDNIIFEIPITSTNGMEEYIQLAEFVSIVQDFLLRNHLLVRGGITIGLSYTDRDFVLGKALVDSYTIESKQAIYPRIVIDSKIVPTIQSYISNKTPLSYCCAKDNDGLFYIDYLRCPGRQYKDYISLIEDALRYNESEMNKHYGNSSIMPKLLWHNNYLRESHAYYLKLLEKNKSYKCKKKSKIIVI